MRRRTALVVLFAASLPCLGAAQRPTFTSARENVRVDVLVTDGGEVVRGLTKDDFEVLDSGVPQQVELVSFEQLPLDVIVALDMSASIRGERLEHLRAAGRALLRGLAPQDRAALISFSRAVAMHATLDDDRAAVSDALDRLVPLAEDGSGSTALLDGVFSALTYGGTENGRTLLLVFSDGVETSSWLSERQVLETARSSDVVAYGVSTVQRNRSGFLSQLAAATGGDAVTVQGTGDAGAEFVRILQEFRHRYLVSYSPSGVPADGWHPLVIRVKGRRAQVRARAGYGN